MESAAVPAEPPAGAATGEKGLKKNAIGFIDGLSIGLASTAPAYSLAAVIGSPDDERGEIVKAYVVASPDAEPGDELARELQTFVRERLAAYEYPRAVSFVDELPMTVTGKIRRGELRRLDSVHEAGLGETGRKRP